MPQSDGEDDAASHTSGMASGMKTIRLALDEAAQNHGLTRSELVAQAGGKSGDNIIHGLAHPGG